ncbi:MAG TPA: hypothetical protein VKP69_23905 [Isosphaeraceae bacterium]|nr:hypothetical protein [Isosphaeraceae bacterium]
MDLKPLALVLAVLVVAGCTRNRAALRREALYTRIGGGGQIIEPRRCLLQVAILTRPLRDEDLNAVWRVADPQVIPTEVRHALEVNGVRIGLITGDLPAAVEAILKAPSPHKVEPTEFILPDGAPAMVNLCESTPTASLLLNRRDRAFGKDYQDASGWLRVTANQEGPSGVALRFVPEIHHGPIQHSFGAVPNAGSYSPQQFMLKDGQQEETLRELAASLTLEPGQAAVLGGPSEHDRSLGSFLFTQPEVQSDRLNQKIVLIWAARGTLGAPGAGPEAPAGLVPVDPPEMAAAKGPDGRR